MDLKDFFTRANLFQSQLSEQRNKVHFSPNTFYEISAPTPQMTVDLFLQALLQEAIPILSHANSSKVHLQEVPRPGFIGTEFRGYGSYSSGSSGANKCHFYDLKSGLKNASWHSESLGLKSTTEILQTLPVTHPFGIVAYILTPVLLDCRIKYTKAPLEWTTADFGESTFVHLIPAQLDLLKLIEKPCESASISIGAGVAPKKKLDLLLKKFRQIYVTYGLSEAGPRVSTGRWNIDSPQGWIGTIFKEIDYQLGLTEEDPNLKKLSLKSSAAEIKLQGAFFDTGDLIQEVGPHLIYKGRSQESLRFRGKTFLPQKFSEFKNTEPALIVSCSDHFYVFASNAEDQERARVVFADLKLPTPSFESLSSLQASSLGKITRSSVCQFLKVGSEFVNSIYFPGAL